MKKRFQGFRILFIGGIFFLLGTNFLAILFPAGNQNHKNYWYSSVGFELVPTTYAADDDDDEDEDRENRKERKRDREDHEDESRDREDHKDNDEDDYYYIPPVSPTPTNPTTPTPANPPSTICRTVYDTVTSASGVKSQVPRQVCDTTTPVTPEKVAIPPVPVVSTKPVTPVTQKDSPIIQSTHIQGSDDLTSGYISDAPLSVATLPDAQNSTEAIITPSNVSIILSDTLSQEIPSSILTQEDSIIPTSRLIERIAIRDGRTYSIIKDLQSGKYILLDEENGKGDPHTFQFKQDAITYATISESVPQTFIERIFQFFASLLSGPSESPVIAESSIITKTQLLAQVDVQTRTMERKILKQKVAEAMARSEITTRSEIQNAQKPTITSTVSVQKKVVPVLQKPTAQVTPKKSVAPVQEAVPKKSTINTVTQAS